MARIKTPVAFASYPNVVTPQANEEGQEPRYSLALVFGPDADLKELKAAAHAVGVAKFGKGFDKAVASGKIRWPFRDDEDDVAEKGYPEGSTFMNVRSKNKPTVVSIYPGPDGKPKVLTDAEVESQLYGGAVVRATIEPYAYDVKGNKGVTFGLGNVQVVDSTTPRFDGRPAAEDEFAADASKAADLSDLEDDSSGDFSDLLG